MKGMSDLLSLVYCAESLTNVINSLFFRKKGELLTTIFIILRTVLSNYTHIDFIL